jgi:hypothetical protein
MHCQGLGIHLAMADPGLQGPHARARQIAFLAEAIAMICAPDVALVATVFPVLTAAARFEERSSTLRRLMLALDVMPVSGQEAVRDKMLLILRSESLRLESPIAAADPASLSNAMTELEHEAGRFAHTPGLFNRHVEIAIRALRRSIAVPASPLGLARRRLVPIDTAGGPAHQRSAFPLATGL